MGVGSCVFGICLYRTSWENGDSFGFGVDREFVEGRDVLAAALSSYLNDNFTPSYKLGITYPSTDFTLLSVIPYPVVWVQGFFYLRMATRSPQARPRMLPIYTRPHRSEYDIRTSSGRVGFGCRRPEGRRVVVFGDTQAASEFGFGWREHNHFVPSSFFNLFRVRIQRKPKPLSPNFSIQGCNEFFPNMTNSDSFRSCHSFGMLQPTWSYDEGVKDSRQTEWGERNEVVVQMRITLLAYPCCLLLSNINMYCYVSSIAQPERASTSSEIYLYSLPLVVAFRDN
ncbi:hypothetical protein D9758_013225 [Tetrapyrgos nigripes]|uniref:Uncharacterized protein n=1 Tax=Tetrapyrgos nigripes TaxID=182062 RepID=A0A8H5CRG5_9AGAR|nr:hypothetical protein D9758_013225 [Tetrapyrgos nigripes]